MKTHHIIIRALLLLALGVFLGACSPKSQPQQGRTGPWTKEQAWQWSKQWGWLRGCNFQPSTAINQLEMWQADTFDPATIDRELGWAAGLGFNSMRVYLHHAAWNADRAGFKKRMAEYLDISQRHGISTMFVFFDDCWNPTFTAGRQPDPKPGIHNSGWVRDPGDLLLAKPESERAGLMALLETYMKDILTSFKDDKRIVLWDLYNEPGNSGYGDKSMPLVKKAFEWARAVNPSQPLTIGIWKHELKSLNKYQLENSDIITYHDYKDLATHQKNLDALKPRGRPMLCTEYMARHFDSTFQSIMPMLKRENVGAYNWGFVAGKTNTIFKWDDPRPNEAEPPLWFHDILRKDGTPYRQDEIDAIKALCK
jgi:hypothetical protein